MSVPWPFSLLMNLIAITPTHVLLAGFFLLAAVALASLALHPHIVDLEEGMLTILTVACAGIAIVLLLA